MRTALARLRLVFAFALAGLGATRGEEARIPTPKEIVYPGDVLSPDMLTDAAIPAEEGAARSAREIVGLAANRTLLPGRPIPLVAVVPPRRLRAGSTVRMIYLDRGLEITAVGDALQDGFVGESVKLRNEDSGVTVTGRVRADGAVVVSGG